MTQAEAYMRGAKSIDDCANTTITVNHPAKAMFTIEQKREFQNQWYEAKVYFKNFELLITGCLCGNDGNDNVDAFLGASLRNYNAAENYWRLYVPKESVSVVRECRLLRNFAKAATNFQWLLKYRRFQESGFGTACALALHEVDKVDGIVATGSLLSWKALDQKDKQKLRSMLFRCKRVAWAGCERHNTNH